MAPCLDILPEMAPQPWHFIFPYPDLVSFWSLAPSDTKVCINQFIVHLLYHTLSASPFLLKYQPPHRQGLLPVLFSGVSSHIVTNWDYGTIFFEQSKVQRS